MAKRVTTADFIERAKAIYGDRYDYSQVEYVSAHAKVTITCPDHGPFQQVPASHLFQAAGRYENVRNVYTGTTNIFLVNSLAELFFR